jgi:hypothetical protein
MRMAYAIAALLAIPVYLPRLFRSFWVDEAWTFWMAHEGIWSAIARSEGSTGQSILYGAITSLLCVQDGMMKEPLLRLPSLAGIGLTLYFTSRLARRAMGPPAGLCTFVLLLFHPLVLETYTQARPYALAAAAVAASFCMLYEWVETRERRFAAGYAVATALIFYLHYLYSTALLAQACFLFWVFAVEKRTTRWKDLGFAAITVAVLAVPLLQQLRKLAGSPKTLVFSAEPAWLELLTTLAPVMLVFGVICASAVVLFTPAIWGMRRKQWKFPAPGFRVLVLIWWLGGPVLLFFISRVTPIHVFVARYLGSSAPADVLLLTAIGVAVFEWDTVIRLAFIAVLVSTASPVRWRTAWQPGGMDARPAIEIVRRVSPAQPPPMFFRSSFHESNRVDWRRGLDSQMFSELVAYPVSNRFLPLPIRFDEDAKQEVSGLLNGHLKDAPIVLFVQLGDVPEWVTVQMASRRYRLEVERPNAYSVAIFRR